MIPLYIYIQFVQHSDKFNLNLSECCDKFNLNLSDVGVPHQKNSLQSPHFSFINTLHSTFLSPCPTSIKHNFNLNSSPLNNLQSPRFSSVSLFFSPERNVRNKTEVFRLELGRNFQNGPEL